MIENKKFSFTKFNYEFFQFLLILGLKKQKNFILMPTMTKIFFYKAYDSKLKICSSHSLNDEIFDFDVCMIENKKFSFTKFNYEFFQFLLILGLEKQKFLFSCLQ